MSTIEPTNDSDAVPAGSEPPSATANPPRPLSKRKAWITPTLGAVAALAIGLVGGILIGQNTATRHVLSVPARHRATSRVARPPRISPPARSSR